ncbi:MAG: NAD(P)-dependent oxidoreductase [Hyphomicrobium sp.]
MARIVVTGATGFIGRHAVSALIRSGHEVHVLGRTKPDDGSAIFHRVDLMEPEEVRACLDRLQASHLLHLAWYTEPGKFWTSSENLRWLAASLALLEAFARSGGRRAVIAGTCAEYDWASADGRFDERRSPLSPSTLYGVAKDALRRVAFSFAKTAGISMAWGRIFFVYGPGEKPGRLVSDAIRSLCAGREFATTAGTQMRDFIHAEDAGAAFAALTASTVEGEVNVASGQAVTIRSILETIGAITGRADLLRLGALQSPRLEPPLIEGLSQRLNQEVGYKPRRTLEEGLRTTVAAYRDGNLKS